MIKDQDYEALHLYLLWLPMDHIKYTLTTTTQWFHNMYCIPFHKYFKSRFPATNISCHNEPVTTDTMDGTDANHQDVSGLRLHRERIMRVFCIPLSSEVSINKTINSEMLGWVKNYFLIFCSVELVKDVLGNFCMGILWSMSEASTLVSSIGDFRMRICSKIQKHTNNGSIAPLLLEWGSIFI